MSQEMTASEQSATNSGIQTLSTAISEIDHCLMRVGESNRDLQKSYQGSDGLEASRLVEQWAQQAGIIQSNLLNMKNTLEQTLGEYNAEQVTSREEVSMMSRTSSSVFDTLSG